MIKKVRSVIGPNKGFMIQLKKLESQLNGKPYENISLSQKIAPGEEADYLKKIKGGRVGNGKTFV